MKIESVDMKNVRQFFGEQKITFSTDPVRKITLVHGPNTAGKTTLLNSIFWCFYGGFLSGFSDPDRLKSAECSGDDFFVQVAFEHQKKRYVARRSGRTHPSDGKLSVLEIRASGQHIPHSDPERLIGSILPEGLAHFFFFAGEMMEKQLSSGTYQQSATDAIRSVLGLKLAEQARDDLREIRKKRRKHLESLSQGTDLQRITSELEGVESFIETRSDQLTQTRGVISGMEAEIRGIAEKLLGMESSAALQRRKDTVDQDLRSARASLARANTVRQELLPDFGNALFLSGSAKSALFLIDEAITKKRIPSPFDKPFVEDILKSQLCICHRRVEVGSKEYQAVATLLNNATDSTSYQRALMVRGACDLVSSQAEGAAKAFTRAMEQCEHAQALVQRLEQEDERVKDLLKRHTEKNVRDLELQRENLDQRIRGMLVNRQITEQEIDVKKREKEELKKQQVRAKASSPQIARAKVAVELIEALIERLEDELERVERDGRARIRDALNRVVSQSTREKYSADITPDYGIQLCRTGNGDEGKPVLVLSSGERRLLDLCFVAALVSVCRDREQEASTILLPGAVAPLIMDAPFGQLDPEYQALAAQTMMSLTDQLVLLLSKTHWTKEVDTAIRPSLGREYLLVGHRAGPAGDAMPVEIQIEEHRYKQMVYDAPKSFTQIQSIGGGQ